MPHPIAPGFITEAVIRHVANVLNINHYPDHYVLAGWGEKRLTVSDIRRLCTTAIIGARLIEGSADFAFAYGFRAQTKETLPTS
jgi:hypothetical protein